MREAVQVFGAMGLSEEGELHAYITRTAALDQLLGSHRTLTEELGRDLLGGAEMKRLVHL